MITKQEVWRTIPEFPNYDVSSLGRIYNNRHDHMMRTSLNNFGHVKITLTSMEDNSRHTRSVAQLVAEAFVKPVHVLCDQVVVLDGIFTHVSADNLAWRPRWFAWKYTRQLKIGQPRHFHNLRVLNETTREVYESVIDAGMKEGLLFTDVWESTYTGKKVYPNGYIFSILH